MKTLSVMGQTYALAPPKREKLPNVLVSHLKDLDHEKELWRLLTEIERADKRMTELERLDSDDPWQNEEWDDEYYALGLTLTQAVGDAQAHIGYLKEAGQYRTIRRIGLVMTRRMIDRVEREVPGVLTGNWQYLTREAVPF